MLRSSEEGAGISARIVIRAVSRRNQFPSGTGVLVLLPRDVTGKQVERIERGHGLKCVGMCRTGRERQRQGFLAGTCLACCCCRSSRQSATALVSGHVNVGIDTSNWDRCDKSMREGRHCNGSGRYPLGRAGSLKPNRVGMHAQFQNRTSVRGREVPRKEWVPKQEGTQRAQPDDEDAAVLPIRRHLNGYNQWSDLV